MSAETGSRSDLDSKGRRGQLVLLAAVALAVALVPLVLAYLQLGYHDDVHAGSGTTTVGQAETTLERGVHDATVGIPFEYRWQDRSQAVDKVRERLASTIEVIETSGLERGTVAAVSYNETRAARWASTSCPDGRGKEFGACRADRGVIVQERQDRTHVLGAAFDVTVTTPDREVQVSRTIELRSG